MAEPGVPFVIPRGRGIRVYSPEVVHLASWTPVLEDLTPHGLRHGHQVWMDDLDLSEALKVERMGHKIRDIRGVYKHVSPQAREALRAGLQELWKASLRERAALCPHSPVPLLDAMLEPYRRTAREDFWRKNVANNVRALSG
ncbi:hypothetical protein Msi02_71400 [Microbispora siamensis]|uniref:Uncharacterized protein n=2 Tax=Microbispora siamensis TaxID=564413 RepID=A0ABQ4GY04_9ACTN|nr:hypothetical protein Msi02_71400 [Microbispora siamensis]